MVWFKLILLTAGWALATAQQQPAQGSQPPPQQQQQQFNQPSSQQQNQPPPQQQQFNQPSLQQQNQPPPQQQFNQPLPPQQQQNFNQPPPPQQQQFNQPAPPPQQQQFNQPPPPQQQQQFNQPPPQQQQQLNQQPQQQQFAQPPPQQQQFAQPAQQQQFAQPPQQQQQRFAPGVPQGQQQQQMRQPPPPQQQQQFAQQGQNQQRFAPGVPQQQQQVRMAPGVPPQQGRGQPPPPNQALPPGMTPQQFAAQQQQGQQQAQPQFPPGHAANIAPPTPPPPPAQDGPIGSGNWLDSAPGIAMEYKVHVDAGKEDCYWQYVHPGATLYVSYQVLKGGDGSIGMAVRDPKMTVVHPYAWKASSEYEEESAVGGYYSVCLDNQFSRFSAKLVNLYLTTFRYDEWEKFSQELQDMDITVENFTMALKTVDQRIQIMRQFQTMSRGAEARDFNLIQDNSSYVQTWSIAQCLIVILCTVVQVYFVKSFFKDPREKSGAGMKMRT